MLVFFKDGPFANRYESIEHTHGHLRMVYYTCDGPPSLDAVAEGAAVPPMKHHKRIALYEMEDGETGVARYVRDEDAGLPPTTPDRGDGA